MKSRLCPLGLSLLLCLPAFAQTPKPTPVPSAAAAPSATYHWHSIVPKHISSADAAAALHWDIPKATLPAGVERIYIIQSNSSLLLHTTDAGLAEAARLVQTVDLPSAAKPAPQVGLRVEFATASATDIDNFIAFDAVSPTVPIKGQPQAPPLKTASGKSVAQLYQTLTRMPGSVVDTPDAVTADDAPATFSINTQAFRPASRPTGPPPQPEAVLLQASLKITPRINADRTVTLLLTTEGYTGVGSSVAVNLPAAGTVASGQMLMLAGLPLNREKPVGDQELLVFITPTIVDAPPQVRLQVRLVSVSKTDTENLGVTFDPSPVKSEKGLPMPQEIQLRTVTNTIAFQLYQTVTRTRGKTVSVPDRITPGNVAATFLEGTQVPYFISKNSDGLSAHTFIVPPADQKMRRLQMSLSITPRVNADGTVTLVFVPLDGDLNAPPKGLKIPTAKTVASGQVIALSGLPFSKDKPTDDQELLIFVTPTVLNADSSPTVPKPVAVPVVDTGQPDPSMLGIIDTPAEAKRRISSMSNDAELATIAGMLDQQMGISITLRQGNTPFGKVYVHLLNATPSQVLRALARSTGALLTRADGGEYVFAMPQKGPPGPQ